MNLNIKNIPPYLKTIIYIAPSLILVILFIILIYIPKNDEIKKRLAELQEQLPEEKEVSPLLRQISDLGLKSGLEILLWRPETRKPDPAGLYVEIPVQVDVTGGYHDLGIFFSHISQIKRIVNLSNIKLESYTARSGAKIIKANFTASTFSAVTK